LLQYLCRSHIDNIKLRNSANETAHQIELIQNNIGKINIHHIVIIRLLINDIIAEAFSFETLVKNDEVYMFIHANKEQR
jgi:hypothetical protein